MTRLVGVEIRRMRARRSNVIVAGAAVLGILIAGTVLFFRSNTDLAVARVKARQDMDRERITCRQELPPGFQGETPPPGAVPEEFSQPCDILDESGYYRDPRFHMRSYLDVVKGTAGPMIVLALLVGASFIGAEWHHRTIATTLTWEPRRARLMIAKALACASVVFVAVVALQALLAGALAPAAAFRGDFDGTGGTWLRSVVGAVLRSASMAAIASVIGMAIASIGRNTVAAVGVAFAYFAVIENLVRGLKPQWQPWLLGENAAIFVSGGRLEGILGGRSVLGAGLLLSSYAAGAFVLAVAWFRARDVSA